MDGTEILIVWLSELGEARTERPTGAPLPFRTVRRIGGGDDDLTDRGLYSVATFATTETAAADEGMNTHRRTLALGGQTPVTLSTGAVYVDDVVVIEHPVTMKWADNVYRSVGTYEVALRAY